MRILITGSTSPQASSKTAQKIPTFASLLYHHLLSKGVSVDFKEPSIHFNETDLDQYDLVFVGIAPPTSLSATRIYPAFLTANIALRSEKLVLFVDAPEPYKIQASIKSCYLNISDLQKNFYQMRKFYSEFVSNKNFQKEVYEFIEFLHTQEWPTLLYPTLPWSNDETIRKALPNTKRIIPLNLDSTLIQVGHISPNLDLGKTYWTCDSEKTSWAKKTAKTLALPVLPTRARRWDLEEATLSRMRNSVGTLVSLYRSGEAWWSPALSQSLGVGVPVVTDWRYSQMLGPEWSHLAYTIEEMSNYERFDLAIVQRDFYLGHLKNSNESTLDLDSVVQEKRKTTHIGGNVDEYKLD